MIETNIPNRPVQIGDRIIPPVIASIVFWKEALKGNVAVFSWLGKSLSQQGYAWGGTYTEFMEAQNALWGRGYCALCEGLGTVNYEYGYFHCLCSILEKRYALSGRQEEFGSYWSRQSLDGMQIISDRSTPDAGKQLTYAIQRTRSWIENPDKWLVYSGGTGTGKTRMISAIMAEWWPYSLYVVASDFETRLRTYLSTNQDMIVQYTDALQYHPILILDDYGIEHGTEWIKQKLDALIEHRSREVHWFDRLTIVATNLKSGHNFEHFKEATSRNGVSRSGSRLTDVEKVDWMKMSGLDFRGINR